MVTMRRDIAAMEGNIFDMPNREQCYLTDYDLFMKEKRKSEEILQSHSSNELFNNEKNANSSLIVDAIGKVQPQVAWKKKEEKSNYNNYNDYMMAQLNRDKPEKILTEDEFNCKQVSSEVIKKSTGEKYKLSRGGKIFLGIYAAIVAIVAMIFILV